jgi:hypothetical protein
MARHETGIGTLVEALVLAPEYRAYRPEAGGEQ